MRYLGMITIMIYFCTWSHTLNNIWFLVSNSCNGHGHPITKINKLHPLWGVHHWLHMFSTRTYVWLHQRHCLQSSICTDHQGMPGYIYTSNRTILTCHAINVTFLSGLRRKHSHLRALRTLYLVLNPQLNVDFCPLQSWFRFLFIPLPLNWLIFKFPKDPFNVHIHVTVLDFFIVNSYFVIF